MPEIVIQRFILPADRDLDVIPLYVDTEPAMLDADRDAIGSDRAAQMANKVAARQATSAGTSLHPDQIIDRTQLRVLAGTHLSLGTYFNGFAASYWRKWTVVKAVRLDVAAAGAGTTITVYRSMANGRSQRVESQVVSGSTTEVLSFNLDFGPFQDGGWYWFDVTAGAVDGYIEDAVWVAEVPEDRVERSSVTIGITTMNRPDFCADLLAGLGSDPEVVALVDEVLVMEQGTDKVTDSPRFAAAEESLDGKLRVIEQANLGGSGGFARAQFETLAAGRSKYVLFLDDDIICEPESIIRLVTFGDLCRRTSIIGGHMFSLYARSTLHSYGEIVNRWRFWWESPASSEDQWDFGARNLRSTRWLHRRVDVDFNPWFMCLIPVEVIEEIGLSLPLFIKWDDSEYGVRAQAAGIPTVTLPGAAVWHIPWTDKNDALDWQAYFHLRNRLVAALIHSPFKHGGRLPRESFNNTVRHLITMQYSTAEIRDRALEDVLAGPDKLHADLATKLGEVRELRQGFDDSNLQSDPDAFPLPLAEGGGQGYVADLPDQRTQMKMALKGGVRQFRRIRPASREMPEAVLGAQDARWYELARLDSAVVSMPDGTAAAFYRRQPKLFRSKLRRTLRLHWKLYRKWAALSRQYRAALPEITSPETWEKTFKGGAQ